MNIARIKQITSLHPKHIVINKQSNTPGQNLTEKNKQKVCYIIQRTYNNNMYQKHIISYLDLKVAYEKCLSHDF